MNKPFRSSLRSVVAINLHLLTAAGCGFFAWAIWPRSPEWWGLGVLAVLLGITAIFALAKALGEAVALWRKERVLAAYLAQGGPARPSRLATVEDLRRAGMLDD